MGNEYLRERRRLKRRRAESLLFGCVGGGQSRCAGRVEGHLGGANCVAAQSRPYRDESSERQKHIGVCVDGATAITHALPTWIDPCGTSPAAHATHVEGRPRDVTGHFHQRRRRQQQQQLHHQQHRRQCRSTPPWIRFFAASLVRACRFEMGSGGGEAIVVEAVVGVDVVVA